MTRKTSYPPLHHEPNDWECDDVAWCIRDEAVKADRRKWWRGLIRAAVTLLVLGLSFYAGTVAFAALSCQ